MRIFAASLEEPTPAFLSAVAALKLARHEVDFFRHRSYAEPVKQYQAALVGVGDFTSEASMRTKLAITKACAVLPVCYFLDRSSEPMYAESDQFWKSAIFSEGASAGVHRAEMLTAMKHEQSKLAVERVLDQWRLLAMGDLNVGLTPTFQVLESDREWNPTPFVDVQERITRKDVPLTIAKGDVAEQSLIARSVMVERDRSDLNGFRPRWSPLPVVCATFRTLYSDVVFDEQPLEAPPAGLERDRLVDQQRRKFLTKTSREDSAATLDKLFRLQIRNA